MLSIVLLGVWLGLGKVMGYDDSNWWLIIGTYTGLVSHLAWAAPDCTCFSIQHMAPQQKWASAQC